jgi:glutathione reductase (NADPH)
VLFVGGGYVTFEFAHIAARAGANVTIVELGPRPLPNFDPNLVDCLVDRTRALGIDLYLSTEVVAIESTSPGGYVVHTKSEQASSSFDTDMVVHGAGRVPNVTGLDLEAGSVRYGRQGIEVNDHLQSVSNPAVYAAGDVAATGAPALSPIASEDGRTLVHNLLEKEPRKPDYGPVPTVVFSVPALAAVGLREDEARRQGLDFEARSGDRARDNSMKKVGAKYARYKVLVEKSSDRILGAHLLGPDASETINLFALAMKAGLSATEMKSTLFAFPTFAHDVRGML